MPASFCHFYNFQPVSITLPTASKKVPAILTESAVKEEMFKGFLRWIITEKAVMIRANVVMPPFQHISGIQPIRNRSQQKNLIFGMHLAFQIHKKAGCGVICLKQNL